MHFYREFCENQALQGVQILRGLQILYGVHFPWGVQHPRGVQIPSGINILVFSPTSLVRFRVATQTDNVRVGDWNPREGLKVVSVFRPSSFLSFFLSFTNGSFPFWTTDLTHVTFKLRSSSAHHCVLCGSKVEHLILFAGFRSITELSFYSVSTQKQ